jgi:hypothetical protein
MGQNTSAYFHGVSEIKKKLGNWEKPSSLFARRVNDEEKKCFVPLTPGTNVI